MHSFHVIAALLGLIMLTGACSSERDEARPLPISTTGSDEAFSYYDVDHDLLISPRDLLKAEEPFAGTSITSEDAASQILEQFDVDGTGRLDSIEFTGLLNAKILAGAQHHPEWTRPRRSR